ncbi:HAD family hydrolase [uncultured Campylobacter sp.]|uniref:HAD family hydrolase n=1 Tax=uncultured Campylobacter sp. TaxID=218934 RepID=UPI002605031E|nr:HAD family hydrolase [uncultured Campylobacter sp.]
MKTVIFDMDGTLLDSSRAIEVSVNNTRRELYGLAPIQRDFIVRTINDPSKNAFLEFYGKTKASAEELAFFEKEFVKNYHEFAVLYDGIDGLLRHCKSSGYFVALASNAPAYTLQEILRKTGSRELFDLVVGADEHTPSKPDPAMLLRTIALSPHKKAIFLGDSKKDELAAIRGAEFLQNLQLRSGKNGEGFSAGCDTGGENLGSSGGNFNAGGDSDGKNFSSDGAAFGSDDATALSFKGGKISAKAAAGELTAQTAAGKARGVQLNLSDLLGARLEYLQVNWGFGEPSEISRNAQSVEQAREIIDGI